MANLLPEEKYFSKPLELWIPQMPKQQQQKVVSNKECFKRDAYIYIYIYIKMKKSDKTNKNISFIVI